MNIKGNLDLINIPEDVSETVGGFLKNGHELVDTLSECSPYLSFANMLMNKRREYKCKAFLQGLGMKVLSREELTSDDLQKLGELLKKNVNRLLVLDILEESTKTVSDVSSKLLGIIAGKVMKENKKFDYKDWILVNALKNMNDWDIENFKKVCLYFDEHSEVKNPNSACVYLNVPMKDYMRNSPMKTNSDLHEDFPRNVLEDEEFKLFKSSLTKMNNLQILSTGSMLADDDNTTFVRSLISDELYELVSFLNQE
uniref:hypothetical protein n=1 Tax=Bacillus basilensis TaxID=3243721 RepID=UPI001E2FF2C1|nr:hypothetical protein [Bacillus sp. (in: firmicutes)]